LCLQATLVCVAFQKCLAVVCVAFQKCQTILKGHTHKPEALLLTQEALSNFNPPEAIHPPDEPPTEFTHQRCDCYLDERERYVFKGSEFCASIDSDSFILAGHPPLPAARLLRGSNSCGVYFNHAPCDTNGLSFGATDSKAC
jgi:hypothetical protein